MWYLRHHLLVDTLIIGTLIIVATSAALPRIMRGENRALKILIIVAAFCLSATIVLNNDDLTFFKWALRIVSGG